MFKLATHYWEAAWLQLNLSRLLTATKMKQIPQEKSQKDYTDTQRLRLA